MAAPFSAPEELYQSPVPVGASADERPVMAIVLPPPVLMRRRSLFVLMTEIAPVEAVPDLNVRVLVALTPVS
jgi:hypothetical protein